MSTNNEIKDDNKAKNKHGDNAQNSFEHYLDSCKERGLIKDYIKYTRPLSIKNYRVYAPFIIIISSTEYWAVFSTTSIRDRIKSNLWDSLLLKNLYDKDNTPIIKKCYLVCPDSLSSKEQENYKRASEYIQKINEKGTKIFDTLDAIITQTGFRKLMESRKISAMSKGAASDFQGNNFEKEMADILQEKTNIDHWNGIPLTTGNSYHIFKKILEKFGLSEHHTIIESIHTKTGNDVPRLPSGGKAKTDIIVYITTSSESHANATQIYTISCKYYSGKSVTAHEYSAQSFIDTLHIEEKNVQQALINLQKVGGYTSLNKEDINAFETDFQKYKTALCEWVIGGIHGEGNPKTQMAQYVLTANKGTSNDYDIEIHTLSEYVKILIALEQNNLISGQLKTPFIWTYAAGTRGTKIQLKMPVLTKKLINELKNKNQSSKIIIGVK